MDKMIIDSWNLEHYVQYSSCPSLQKTHVTLRASRNFEDNLRVGLVRYEAYTAHEQLLTS